MKHLIFTNNLAPGDVVVASAFLRDLHRTYPGEYLTAYQGTCSDYFMYAPHITHISKLDRRAQRIKLSYDCISRSNQERLHFLTGYYRDFNRNTGLSVRMTEFKPELYLPEAETVAPPIGGPYWVIASGGKNDFTAKWWNPDKWQQVVDALRGVIQFVQVGERTHHHPPLRGVLDMRGRTTFRGLCRLIYHSQGVCCVVTCLMHLAAACNKPCVVVAGGREPWWWEAYTAETRQLSLEALNPGTAIAPYPGQVEHQYLHTMGMLECCQDKGCWKSKVEPDTASSCQKPVQDGSVMQPTCLTLITPAQVVEAVRSYKPSPTSEKPAPTPIDSHVEEPITICALLYGDHLALHKRFLHELTARTDQKLYHLRLGLNEVCQATKELLRDMTQSGIIASDRLTVFDEPVNICKYPIMRKMFHDQARPLTTRWVLWLDDDVRFTRKDWLPRLFEQVNKDYPHGYGCFGKQYWMQLQPKQCDFVRAAQWYRKRSIPTHPVRDVAKGKTVPVPKSDFATGSFWLIERKTIETIDWPDPRIHHNGGDVMLGAALHQHGIKLRDHHYGIVVNSEPRRGVSERPAGT